MNYRMKLEMQCEDCEGNPNEACSGCDGTGFQEIYVSLEEFKALLSGGESS